MSNILGRLILAVCVIMVGLGGWPASVGADDAPGGAGAVQVMSFNIRYGSANDGPNRWENRREMVVEVIDASDADFVGMQEALAFQIEQILGAVPRYASVGVGREDGESAGEFSNILYDESRWRVDEEHHGTFWLSETPEVPGSTDWGNNITRICTWARFVERETDRAVYVFNTHWDHRSQNAREKSAELVMQRIAERPHTDEPVVLMGDMNAGEDNPAMRYVRGEVDGAPLEMVDTFRVVHPEAEEVGTFNGFEFGRTDGAKIDHILVEPGATVLDARIDRTHSEQRYPSDHFPVTARVRWEN